MAIGFKQILYSCKSRILTRTIMSTTTRLQDALEKLQQNPYYEKYADRIATLQKTSPEEFLERIEKHATTKKEPSASKIAAVDTRQYSSVLNPKQDLKENLAAVDKKLDEILKLDLVKDKDVTEIQTIWEEYHKQLPVISAIIPVAQYSEMRVRVQKHPTFLFPLPRSESYEFFLCQACGNTLHFTPLLAYQVHKENAPECLTVTHYTELEKKGIVLMRGEYDKNVLSGKEAQCLANQYQMYYGANDEEKTRLLETFTNRPDAFKHMDLIAQLEKIELK